MPKYDLHNISASRLLNLLEPGLQQQIMDALEEKADTIIIPAQPGWFVGTVFDDNTLDKDAVIACRIAWDEDHEDFKPWPITCNPALNSVFGTGPGHVLCDPHGNYFDAGAPNKNKAMKSEEEAIRWKELSPSLFTKIPDRQGGAVMNQKHGDYCRCSACFERHLSSLIAKGEVVIVTDANGEEILYITEKGRKRAEKISPGKGRKPS